MTDLPVAQVRLVAQNNERKVRWVLRLSLGQELLPPHIQGVETAQGCDIKHQHAAVAPSVQRCAQRLEPLCACCVPDLINTHTHTHLYIQKAQGCMSDCLLKTHASHCDAKKPTCRVTVWPSILTALEKKSVPMVALYMLVKR